jgi:hypothetical protein
MANETTITVIGNLVEDPALRFTPSGAAVANFTVASTPDAALTQAAGGDWLNLAACRSQPAFTDQDLDSITATCSRCRVAADCAKLGRLELARALGDKSDRGEQRVYAGHQLRDLLLLARRDTAGRKAAYQALDTTLQRAAGLDTFGHNCGCCGRSVDACMCPPTLEGGAA